MRILTFHLVEMGAKFWADFKPLRLFLFVGMPAFFMDFDAKF